MQRLEEQFIAALRSCNKYKEKRTLWIATMTLLNSDPIFANNGASALLTPQGTEEGELVVSAQELFSRLSSGHKVILLTLTCLVAITMERTLVLMDEPENHLHPPLLSAFVRALSALLIQKTDWLLFLRTRLLFCRKYLKLHLAALQKQHNTACGTTRARNIR